MPEKFAIFDLDGTLLDSMPYWLEYGYGYLREKGAVITPQTRSVLDAMSLSETVQYCRREQGLDISAEEVMAAIEASMRMHYETDIPLKPGALELLEQMKRLGYHMCVLTATRAEVCGPSVETCGIGKYLDFLMDCEDFPQGKNTPDVFFAAARRLGADPASTLVFEDSPHAVRSLAETDFTAVGVADVTAAAQEELVRSLAAYYAEDLSDPGLLAFVRSF